MKSFLLPLITVLALPTAVNAEISDEIHKRCKDAKDYIGCIKVNNKQTPISGSGSFDLNYQSDLKNDIQLLDTANPHSKSNKDFFHHKGKKYVASKECPEGKQFIWQTQSGFLQKDKVSEIGCLSDFELESLKNQSSQKTNGTGINNDLQLRNKINGIRHNNLHRHLYGY